MAAADPIVHSGPVYGIPIAEARPILDRLEELVPEHADTRFHQAIVSVEVGTPDTIAAAMASAARVMGAPWGPVLSLAGRLQDASARGMPLPPAEAAFPAARALAAASRSPTPFYATLGTLGIDTHFAAYKLDALDRIRAAGIYSGDVDLASTLGEGSLRLSRGDWIGGLRALRRTEGSSLAFSDRMTGARLACLGAWLGVVNAATADSTLRRMRASPGSETLLQDRVELRWLDGLLGIVAGDSSRVQSARRALLADTAAMARWSARSLDGLWLARTNLDAGADTLRAVSEAGMREGGFLLSVESIDRLVVARALRKRGTPAEVERYLMWPDASTSVPRSFTREVRAGAAGELRARRGAGRGGGSARGDVPHAALHRRVRSAAAGAPRAGERRDTPAVAATGDRRSDEPTGRAALSDVSGRGRDRCAPGARRSSSTPRPW